MRIVRLLACSIVALALHGCGGGGGGGDSGGRGGTSGSLTLSPGELTYATNDMTFTPLDQTLSATINTNASGTIYLRVEVSGPAVALVDNIQITGPTTGRARVVAAPAVALGPGSHSSTIKVTACTSGPTCPSGIIGSPQVVNVTYTVTGVIAASSALSFTLGASAAAADYAQSLPVIAYPSFNAVSNVDWLRVAPGSGSQGRADLALSLVQSAVDGFESGPHTATLQVNAPGGNTLQVPVTLTVTKPQLDQVAPYVAEANRPGTVIVRGLYFDLLPNGSIDLSLSESGTGIAPSSVTVISPTEIRLTHPALSAGTYFVRMHDAQGSIIDRSEGRLVVVEPTSYTATTLSYPADGRLRNVQSMFYDAERKTLFMVHFHGLEPLSANDLVRFEHTSTWSAAQITPYPHLDRLALSANGRDLIAASSPEFNSSYRPKLQLLSPTTLLERASLQTPDDHRFFAGLAVLNTNEVFALGDSRTTSGGGPTYRYSVKRNSVTPVTYENAATFSEFVDGTIVASGDGQRVVAASDAGSSADQSIFEYDAGSSSPPMKRAPLRFDVRAMSMDRTGDRLLIRGQDFFTGSEFVRVYDRNWNALGSLPLLADAAYLLAPDGTRAYIYGLDGEVHVFDLTAPLVAGGFPEIASLVLAGSPDQGLNVRMAISSDGRTLFVAGGTQVVVQPLP